MVSSHLAHLLLTICLQLLFVAMSFSIPLPHHYHHSPTPLLSVCFSPSLSPITSFCSLALASPCPRFSESDLSRGNVDFVRLITETAA